MAGASSSSGSSRKYDVFISFRGEDTRRCFVCHLNKALKQKALDIFIDSEKLRKGDDLSELLIAIQHSRLSLVVFSKNYASSTWCLKELARILECMKTQNQIVVPVFYKTDPSDVRKLKESFAEAFAKHESGSNVDNEELESWRSSLKTATNLSGFDSKNYQDDVELIESIVENILKKLIWITPSETDGLIGMDSHMDAIDSLLQLEKDDVRTVGIWGMGGIGKSTIARAVYGKIAPQFVHKCFLDNVKEGFLTKNGAVQKVEEFLSSILKVNNPRILDGGLNMMRQRLGNKRILLVLDDADDLFQIETLIGEIPLFGPGSRIIITTRDQSLLARCLIYKPQVFTNEKALELFKRYAFRTNKYSESYEDISRRALQYAHGLPLALKVLGAFLDNKTVSEWEYELEKIRRIPITFLDNKIGRVLWASYDGLDDWQKNIFLDIACFFRGKDKDFVTYFHESCGFFPKSGLRVLVDRALLTFSSEGQDEDEPPTLEMHDLIQEVGRDIVRRESTNDMGKRSRLWKCEDVRQVLAQNTAAEDVEGITLDLTKLEKLDINNEAFVSMKKLRLLQLEYPNVWDYELLVSKHCKQEITSGDLLFLSNQLRVLIWHGCPLECLPSDFLPKNLIYIDMRHSYVELLWEGTKPLQNLVHVDLSYSEYLIETTDFTKATNLQKLVLQGCKRLSEVHPSISSLKSLVELDLSHCSNLQKFPNISGNMKELRELYLEGTAITEIPSSINDLPKLQCLTITGCKELKSLPSSNLMNYMRRTLIDLSGYSKLEQFPVISEVMEEPEMLKLDGTAIKELPSSISNLTGLKWLSLVNCRSLVCLPDSICNLSSLETLKLCMNTELESLPAEIDRLRHLRRLDLRGCKRMKSIPELSSSIEEIQAENCSSLEMVSTPQPPSVEHICLMFLNCFKLVNSNLFIDIVERLETARDIQFDCRPQCHVSLPGSDIPEWFNHQSRGSSVTVQLQPDFCFGCKSLGLAICGISNLRGAHNRKTLESAVCCCTFRGNDDKYKFSFPLIPHSWQGGTDMPLESDHMFLGYKNPSCQGMWHEEHTYTEAIIKNMVEEDERGTNCILSDGTGSMVLEDCIWITSCGVRFLQVQPYQFLEHLYPCIEVDGVIIGGVDTV